MRIQKRVKYLNTAVYDTLQKMDIRGIPKIYAVSKISPSEYIIEEEFIEGRTLFDVLKDGLYQTEDAVRFIMKLCKILRALHKAKIVHGDLKPENIIVDEKGNPHIIDFNASHLIVKKSGRDTVMLGTPGFASPEQYGFSRSDERSDIYAVGQILNVMISGGYVQTRPVKEPIFSVISKCTQIDPDRRFQTVFLLQMELRNYRKRRHMKIEALPPGFRTRTWWKMLIAAVGYFFITWVPIAMHSEGANTFYEDLVLKVLVFVSAFLSILAICNYKDINELFPFARKNLVLRLLSKVLQCFIVVGTAMLLAVILLSIQ